ncbi:MAG: CotH kinase family protein [Akkermansiaceae bacterium]|nr:CotH kinase family protein [Akkermansiaceae bacterium]
MIRPAVVFTLFPALLVLGSLDGAVLPDPTITAATAPSSLDHAVNGIFDSISDSTEYRTDHAGTDTFIEFDFGAEVVIDGFLNVTRNSSSSVVTGSRLIFDTDGSAGFSAATDTVVNFNAANTGQLGQGYINRFAPVTARYVRWEVTAASGSSQSCGAMEMRFLGTPTGASPVSGVAAIAGSPALDVYHALTHAANGLAGFTAPDAPYNEVSPSVGYSSNGAGTGTYVDFDLGQTKPVTGFDFFDQLDTSQRVGGFTLTFSNDPTFATQIATRSYTNAGFSMSDSFDAVAARYIRYQVTASAGSNPGVSEIIFYQSSGSLLSTSFTTAANPNQNWSHGIKSSPLAASLELFDLAAAADATAPCDRWCDGSEQPAFAGVAPAAAASFDWGGTATDWSAGAFYHAWRADHGFPLVSRYTVPQTGVYDLSATWSSHTVAGCDALVSIVANGSTVFSGNLSGFAGTAVGTPTPSGTAPDVSGDAYGIPLTAGDRVEIVTLPLTGAGNVAVEAVITPGATVAETTDSIVIREFCASNTITLQDEDGDYSDWIEIYNGTGTAVNLDGYGLSDKASEPFKWIFPPRVLAHGQRLVVFASNKDDVKRPGYGSGSELHTNFALSKGGEFLGLTSPEGVSLGAYSPEFPGQYDDFSYGTGSNAVTGYMTPTPGSANGEAGDAPPATLLFSLPSGIISSRQYITISGQSAQHTVRYTTDGTEPTLGNGITYTGAAISIATSTTLRARAFAGNTAGPLADATYTRLGSGTDYGVNPSTFSSALPILVIDTSSTSLPGRTGVPSRLTLIDRDPTSQRATLTGPPALSTRGTIKLRGQWSSTFPKQSWTIEFWDSADQDEKHPLLGMPEESDWTLYASYMTDPDFLRNIITYETYAAMGRWAPRTRLVEVFLNNGGSRVDGADYYGVYVLREKIKISDERVDITKMSAMDNSGDALTGGYIIAHDKYGNLETEHPELLGGTQTSIPHWPYTGGGAFVYKTPSVDDITPAQKAYITDYVLQVDTAVSSPGFIHPGTGLHYTDYIGRKSFIDHHMLMAFGKNLDGIRISTYFEKDRGGKLKMSSVWDNDLSQLPADAGSAGENPNTWNSDVDPSANYTDFFTLDDHTAEGWFHYLHQDPAYMQEWVDRFDRWRSSGVLDTSSIYPLMDTVAAELTTADNSGTANANTPIARNFNRWSRSTRGVSTNGSNAASVIFGSSSSSEINRHKTWLAQRLAFMDTWVLAKPVASPASGPVATSTPLNLDSPDLSGSARIHYTLDGTDPVTETGAVSATASEWSGPLPLTASTRVTARLYHPDAVNKHTLWSAPTVETYIVGATPAATANLVVSELMYHPSDPSAAEIAAGFDNADDFEFIELRNVGTGTINLWGATFTQGILFDFDSSLSPEQVELAPGQTLLLASNPAAFLFRYGATAAARLVGGFADGTNLSNGGETLTLLDRDGGLLLEFTYDDTDAWPVEADGGGGSLHYLGGSFGQGENWLVFAPDPGRIIADHDGDGQDDGTEWLAGSDPANAASVFRILDCGLNTEGAFTMSFPVAAGHRYRIDKSTDLEGWIPAGTDFTATETGIQSFIDPENLPDYRFYRVVALPR